MVIHFDPDKERLPMIVTRDQWEAKPTQGFLDDVVMPATFVFITYAGAVGSCTTEKECIKSVQSLQKFHMDNGQPDLPYNFLIGGDRQIYEGRGWFSSCHPPPERSDLYKKSYVFAFIGPLRANYEPNMKDFRFAYQLINYALDNSYLNDEDVLKKGTPNIESFRGMIELVRFGQEVNNIDKDDWNWKCKVRDWNTYR